MSDDQTASKNIDEYIAGFSGEVRERLEGIRRVVREAGEAEGEGGFGEGGGKREEEVEQV